jgi:sugar O-acyltransferase (sialic acid O-acetyltransferase NeuD family)
VSKPVLILGAGGHASVLADVLRKLKVSIVGIVSPEKPVDSDVFAGLVHYADDEQVFNFAKDEVLLVNGIGSQPDQDTRFRIHQKFEQAGYQFMTVVSPDAIVSEYALLGEGVQILPGCIVNANAKISEGTIINSGAIIEHDCYIGLHNHIAPGAVLCGGVRTGDYAYIGTGAQVIQNIRIGDRALAGAGVTVTQDLNDNSKLYVARPFCVEGK